MTGADDTARSESAAVQLARLRGALDLVARLVEDLAPRVSTHDEAIHSLNLAAQRLDGEAVSREKTVLATAIALKDAKDAQDAALRSENAKSDQSWTPMTRLFAGVSAVSTLSMVAVAAYAAFKP